MHSLAWMDGYVFGMWCIGHMSYRKAGFRAIVSYSHFIRTGEILVWTSRGELEILSDVEGI